MSSSAGVTPPPPREAGFVRWHKRVLGVCLIIFSFELGLFLLVFPWLSSWDTNWAAVHVRFLGEIWMNPYFRGALSGLGLLNIYVAFSEAGRQLSGLFTRKG